MGDNQGKGKILKKESKTIIFTKKKTRGILYVAQGRGWWDRVKGGVGLN